MKNIIPVAVVKILYAIDSMNYKIRLKISNDAKDPDVLKMMAEKETRMDICTQLARNVNSDGEALDKLFGNKSSTLLTDIEIIQNPNVKRITLLGLSLSGAKMVAENAKAKMGLCERDDVTR
ncbi:MAG: hypothetical protein BHV99_03255 [Clostridium sp. 26_21]|nr:MAG: hypothetical protein BHV99_03255 [Clostridium sp. 26_21]